METIAHKTEDGREQTLDEHLAEVAKLTGIFADKFDIGELGKIAGSLHDVGKYTAEFQEYIRGLRNKSSQTHHAAAGAWQAMLLATEYKNPAFQMAAMVIQAHHSDLHTPLFAGDRNWKEKAQNVFSRAVKGGWKCLECNKTALSNWLELGGTPTKANRMEIQRRMEFITRMIFSALIDADRLDTERFSDPGKFALRGGWSSLEELKEKLDAHLAGFSAGTNVNKLRAEMLQHCIDKSALPAGVFSLSIPTGGGKTLASMAFALRHAIANGLHRVIIAIPYTSIITQNADIYAQIFGEQNVLQHHCNLDPDRYNGDEDESQKLLTEELACENWDRPIIVTTNVQLLESLFAASPSKCRKIHNIARSVIIFDEAQTLPPAMLEPTLDMLKTIVKHAHSSLVCCTATQPAWKTIRDEVIGDISLKGIDEITEIIDQPENFHKNLCRVKYHWPSITQKSTWEELAENIATHPRCLVIVPFREHVRRLTALLPDDTIGLSALMTPTHRKAVLEEIKKRMSDNGAACRVIATSLVEAGVDLDFPVVFRAIGPLDSITQAAGRCNREGRMKFGDVYIFIPPENHSPATVIGKGTDISKSFIEDSNRYSRELDMADPQIFRKYFEALYTSSNVDRNAVQASRNELDFPETQNRYRVIDNPWARPLIIPQDEKSQTALTTIIQHNSGENFSSAADLRKAREILQQYTISVSKKIIDAWLSAGRISPLYSTGDSKDTPHYLCTPFVDTAYDNLGLILGEIPNISTKNTIL